MKKIKWNKVTWYSKLLAVGLFCIVLLVGIYIGSESQKASGDVAYHNLLGKQTVQLAAQLLNVKENIYPLHIHPGMDTRYPKFEAQRYNCQAMELVPELVRGEDGQISPNHYATSIHLAGINKDLKKIDPKAVFISYSFDQSCENVYAIVQYSNQRKDIFKYDVYSGNYTQLTKDLYIPTISVEKAQPDPYFIYVISPEKLLVSFITPTTGFDAYNNFSSHRIFNLSSQSFTKTIDFIVINPAEGLNEYTLPPTLLDFKHNILSTAVASAPEKDTEGNTAQYTKLERKDFDLMSEEFVKTTPLNPALLEDQLNELSFNCLFQQSESKEYEKCWAKNYYNLFPENSLKE